MAEPSERDKQQALELADFAMHVAECAIGACEDCGALREDEDSDELFCPRHLSEAGERIARAIASAREEADAAGFERGRRAGMEEACRAACRGCAEALPLKVVELKNVGTLLYHDGSGFTETCGAAPIRALIGGNE